MRDNLILYQAKTGAIELKADKKAETLWANQAQMAELFDTTTQNITMHLRRIFKENELLEKATCKEFLQVQKEGKRAVQRKQKFYNLDAIISVGYRISSVSGTKFRQWATKTLRSHITQGYTVNKNQIAKNYESSRMALAIEDGCAVEIVNHKYRVIPFGGGKAYKVYWEKSEYIQEEIKNSD